MCLSHVEVKVNMNRYSHIFPQPLSGWLAVFMYHILGRQCCIAVIIGSFTVFLEKVPHTEPRLESPKKPSDTEKSIG